MDEGGGVPGVGSFHKTLPHDEFGEVDGAAFADLVSRLADGADLEGVPRGRPDSAPLVNPLGGLAHSGGGGRALAVALPPPPGVQSLSAAAELTELYWMALARDVSLDHLTASHPLVEAAVADLAPLCAAAVAERTPGALRLGLDLPVAPRGLDLRPATLFRCGLLGEDAGPLVSQLMLHDACDGARLTVRKQVPYRARVDYLTDHASWLAAQDGAPPAPEVRAAWVEQTQALGPSGGTGRPVWRRAGTMRDLARFEPGELPHRPFAEALAQLVAWGARVSAGNPYRGAERRSSGHATLGAAHVASLVAEVAGRALRAAWYAQWQLHLRLRPEAYAGLMHMQRRGLSGATRAYGLPEAVFDTAAGSRVSGRGGWFLPVASPHGAPAHPSYAGAHAAVAGACATVLKAWFDEAQTFEELARGARHPLTGRPVRVVSPGLDPGGPPDGTGGCEHSSYAGDTSRMSVGGELNKLASNVALGRCMAGLHWRTDATRGLRLGERVAVELLVQVVADVVESPLRLAFASFDRHVIEIEKAGDSSAELRKNGARSGPHEL